jgi:chitin deacetylase
MKLVGKFFLIILTIVGTLFILGYLFLQLINARHFQFFGTPITRLETDKKLVALTFDDGPTDSTAEVLKIVNDQHIPATFYLIGEQIEKYPELTKEIVNSGHELGNHSYSHQRMIFKSYGFMKREVEMTDSLIRTAGYSGEITFRPPYFKKFILLPYYLDQTNKKTLLADVTPEDEADVADSTEKIVEYTVANTKPGSIILLHPHFITAAARPAIAEIVAELKQQGYEFVTVSTLLKENTQD